jgi:hypothetical protein
MKMRLPPTKNNSTAQFQQGLLHRTFTTALTCKMGKKSRNNKKKVKPPKAVKTASADDEESIKSGVTDFFRWADCQLSDFTLPFHERTRRAIECMISFLTHKSRKEIFLAFSELILNDKEYSVSWAVHFCCWHRVIELMNCGLVEGAKYYYLLFSILFHIRHMSSVTSSITRLDKKKINDNVVNIHVTGILTLVADNEVTFEQSNCPEKTPWSILHHAFIDTRSRLSLMTWLIQFAGPIQQNVNSMRMKKDQFFSFDDLRIRIKTDIKLVELEHCEVLHINQTIRLKTFIMLMFSRMNKVPRSDYRIIHEDDKGRGKGVLPMMFFGEKRLEDIGFEDGDVLTIIDKEVIVDAGTTIHADAIPNE